MTACTDLADSIGYLATHEGLHLEPMPVQWLSFSSLPASQCAWINTKLPRQILLANPRGAAELHDLRPQGPTFAFIGGRHVPEELDDPRDEVESWRSTSPLPVGHRARIDTETLGYFLLKQSQIKALLAQVVS